MTKAASITAGKIYESLIKKERKGDFLGKTVQIIPHVTNEIKSFIYKNIDSDLDFVLCEIGGTVGDIEAGPFLEAIRQIGLSEQAMYLHMTLVPYLKSAKELKTKPTQHSARELRSIGIQADVILCRAEYPISQELRQKIGDFCNLSPENVIPLIDVENIYSIPLVMRDYKLDQIICNHFNMNCPKLAYLQEWEDLIHNMSLKNKIIKVAIVGKYADLDDSYKSISEAIKHSSANLNIYTEITIVDSNSINDSVAPNVLKDFDGIIVPGGFGSSGIEGKLATIKYCRTQNIPMLGICYGMQLAIIEFARNVVNLTCANTSELDKECKDPVIYLLEEWNTDHGTEKRDAHSDLGGTMRLGDYECQIKPDTLTFEIYNHQNSIFERHRHRYEFNNKYKDTLEAHGLVFSGISKNNELVEIIEIPNHQWFVAVQFHPEFNSSVTNPNPLFNHFLQNLIKKS
jgi:CTP synthase